MVVLLFQGTKCSLETKPCRFWPTPQEMQIGSWQEVQRQFGSELEQKKRRRTSADCLRLIEPVNAFSYFVRE